MSIRSPYFFQQFPQFIGTYVFYNNLRDFPLKTNNEHPLKTKLKIKCPRALNNFFFESQKAQYLSE